MNADRGPPLDPELARLLLETQTGALRWILSSLGCCLTELRRHEIALQPDKPEIERRRSLHALKGSAGIAGERDLSDALAYLERRCQAGDVN